MQEYKEICGLIISTKQQQQQQKKKKTTKKTTMTNKGKKKLAEGFDQMQAQLFQWLPLCSHLYLSEWLAHY